MAASHLYFKPVLLDDICKEVLVAFLMNPQSLKHLWSQT